MAIGSSDGQVFKDELDFAFSQFPEQINPQFDPMRRSDNVEDVRNHPPITDVPVLPEDADAYERYQYDEKIRELDEKEWRKGYARNLIERPVEFIEDHLKKQFPFLITGPFDESIKLAAQKIKEQDEIKPTYEALENIERWMSTFDLDEKLEKDSLPTWLAPDIERLRLNPNAVLESRNNRRSVDFSPSFSTSTFSQPVDPRSPVADTLGITQKGNILPPITTSKNNDLRSLSSITEDWDKTTPPARYQLWPERMIREIARNVFEAGTEIGEAIEQNRMLETEKVIPGVTDVVSTIGTGGLASASARTGSLGVFGGQIGRLRIASDIGYPEAVRPVQAVFENTKLAKMMEERGFDKQQIFDATGLFKGKDNFWRHEISDSGAKLISDAPIGSYKATMEDVLDHPELYKAYPEFKNIEVVPLPVESIASGVLGYADMSKGKFGEIALKEGIDFNKARSIILHELQHAIQTKEGFARGGSDAEWLGPVFSELKSKADAISKKFAEDIKDITTDGNAVIRAVKQEKFLSNPKFKAVIKDSSHSWNTEFVEQAIQTKKVYDALVKAGKLEEAKRVVALGDKIQEAETVAFNKYQALYGEIEARNVQERDRLRRELDKTTHPMVKKILNSRLMHPENTEGKTIFPPKVRFQKDAVGD